MADPHGDISTARRYALRLYRRLPRRVRLLVVHTLAPSHTVGALCLIEHEGALLMLRQHHREGWTLPGGLVNRGEDAPSAVRREVLEETGLHIEVGEPLTTVVDGRSRRVDVLFHVPVAARPPAEPSSEAAKVAWLRPERLTGLDEATAMALAAYDRASRDGARTGRLARP